MNKVTMVFLLDFCSVVVTNEGVILMWVWRWVWALDGFAGDGIICVGGGLSWVNKYCLFLGFPVYYIYIECS